jgi:hypothetical protein
MAGAVAMLAHALFPLTLFRIAVLDRCKLNSTVMVEH